MKPDFYTKIILTVIAVALVVLVIQNSSIVNEAKADKINFNKFATVPVNNDGSINVKMVSEQLDVNVKSIGGSSIYGALPVNLKELGGNSFHGALPVNFKEISGSSISSNGLPVNITAVSGTTVYSAIPVKQQ